MTIRIENEKIIIGNNQLYSENGNLYFTGTVLLESNLIPGPTTIGQAYGGGYYAGNISYLANSAIPTHYLIVAPISSGQTSARYQNSNSDSGGAGSPIDGAYNSDVQNNSFWPAIYFCRNLKIGGYSDWYHPAREELDILYYNLKPTSTQNDGNTYYTLPGEPPFYSGQNFYAVPSRQNGYSSSVPSRTSALDFQSGNTQAFSSAYYWSSTNYSSEARAQDFTNGAGALFYKFTTLNVRAIRKVPV